MSSFENVDIEMDLTLFNLFIYSSFFRFKIQRVLNKVEN